MRRLMRWAEWYVRTCWISAVGIAVGCPMVLFIVAWEDAGRTVPAWVIWAGWLLVGTHFPLLVYGTFAWPPRPEDRRR